MVTDHGSGMESYLMLLVLLESAIWIPGADLVEDLSKVIGTLGKT
jgi:hypothetical protein